MKDFFVSARTVSFEENAYRAPITPLRAVSRGTMPEGPGLGVATGILPLAF